MSIYSPFRDIDTVEALIDYLQSKGKNHQSYYHYTTWESLEKIYANQSFLLTRGNSLNINDQHEALMKGSWQEWNKTYIGSFSYGAAENMAMWGLYGLPWEDAVRIEIPKEAMTAWVNSINEVELWGSNDPLPVNADVHLSDIVYVHGQAGSNKMQLTHRDTTMWVTQGSGLMGVDRDPRMTGYIKNYAWHYENEVRLIVRLLHDEGNEKVKLLIPENVLSRIQVVTGPSFQHKSSHLYRCLQNEGRLRESGFRHLVKYRPLCALCSHKNFERYTEE